MHPVGQKTAGSRPAVDNGSPLIRPLAAAPGSLLREPLPIDPPWITATHRAAVAAADDLAGTGAKVELLGAVAHPSGRLVLAVYALAIALLAGLGRVAPLWALALALALALSARRDLDGGRGWLRSLVPRAITRILLVGPTAPLPEGQRQLLLLLPHSAKAPARPALALALPALSAGLLLAGIGLMALRVDLAEWALAGAGGLALVVAIGAAILADRRPLDFSEGALLARAVLSALPPEAHGRTTLAIVGGLGVFADGAEILLLNHHSRFRRRVTRVLAWSPSPAPLALLPAEGVVVARPASRHLLDRAAPLGLPNARGHSAAATALAHGWSALGLTGGSEDPAAAARTLGELGGRLLLEER